MTATTLRPVPRVALTHTVRAELQRLLHWPALWIIGGAWIALALTFGYIFNYVSYRTGETSFSNEGGATSALLEGLLPGQVPFVVIQGSPLFGGALFLVAGALVAGSGYGWGTWKTIYTQAPTRLQVTAGSLLTVVVTTAAMFFAALLACAVMAIAIALAEGESLAAPEAGPAVEAVLSGYAVLLMWALAGYLVATIAKGPSVAVGLGLVWVLVVENLLRGVGPMLGVVESVTRVLPGTAGGSLVGAVSPAEGEQTPGVLTALSGGESAVVVAAWAAAFVLVTLVVVGRRDVT